MTAATSPSLFSAHTTRTLSCELTSLLMQAWCFFVVGEHMTRNFVWVKFLLVVKRERILRGLADKRLDSEEVMDSVACVLCLADLFIAASAKVSSLLFSKLCTLWGNESLPEPLNL